MIIEIDSQKLRNAAQEIQEQLVGMEKSISDVYSGMRVMDSMWSGPANSAFNMQFAADSARLLEICRSIKIYSEKMKNAATNYEKGESISEDIVKSLRID